MNQDTDKRFPYRQSFERAKERRPYAFARDTPEWRQEHRLRPLYGITVEEFEKLYEQQRGQCRICRASITKTRIKSAGGKNSYGCYACIDHNHETHRVRGLLCPGCNLFLGHFEKRQHLLPHIIAYLANGVLS